MRIPSEREAIAFFKSIGYRVEKKAGEKGNADYWVVFEPRSKSVSGKRRSSLLDIWAQWMPHAIHLINEDAMFRRFMSIYEKADLQEKADLKKIVLDHWTTPMATSRAFAPFREPPYPDTTDALPRDWKARVRKILTQPNGGAYFPARAYFALTALDSQ